MRHALRKIVGASAAVLLASAALAASPVHLYELNNSLADSISGPDLIANGGSLTASSYNFGPNQGLSLDGVMTAALSGVYTVDFVLAFDDLGGWRKMVDFKNLASDDGLYNLNAGLNFYPLDTGAPLFSVGQWAQVSLTRDASGMVTGYLNGSPQWQFDDSVTQRATFSEPTGIAHFFIDDFSTLQNEASAGKVDYIAIYDTALSATEIGQITTVPEPESYALMLAGLAGLALWARRRSR